jgi:hypothetical protein
VAQVIFELEELEPLVERLKRECAALAEGESSREIFVIIDDFDDFGEELENHRTVGRDLANLARRHGRDGLHFIIAGALDSNISELRRQVRAANYGIGLRSAQSVDALGVMRRPPGLQDKELAFGRGYVVKSGQATMLQIASPYGNLGFAGESADDEVLEEQMSKALDAWVTRLVARHPAGQAKWQGITANGEGTDTQPAMNPEVKWGIEVLRQLLQSKVGGTNGSTDDKAILAEAIKAIFGAEAEASWAFAPTAEDVFSMAETMLETSARSDNKHDPTA